MDSMFERLTNLFKTFVNDLIDDDVDDNSGYSEGKRNYTDPDMQDAWDELNDFLNDDSSTSSSSSGGHYSNSNSRAQQKADSEMAELRQDFENLNVPFGASYEEIRNAYKGLLRKYHPDKHANNPEMLKSATEITKKINASFLKLKHFYKKK